ncbi:MAG: helix-turn-helix transcriptional regulator [Hyphomonas sp.]|uniref:helix-turn-helix domain-containing protein n=1 Tax=Hyphomonas sp. BRH_c22 TaxID=1629710 RepID=UPI000A885167|nr:helix-turn-helix transcriptional regulator [Hyphomonas sp. BRH_c22]
MKKPLRKATATRSVTDVDRQVGENVRKFRIAHGMTLVDLSEALGISHQQLQKYETGSNRLSAGVLLNVSRILAVPLADLFERLPSRNVGPKSSADQSRELCRQVIDRTQSQQTLDLMAKVLKVIYDSAGK